MLNVSTLSGKISVGNIIHLPNFSADNIFNSKQLAFVDHLGSISQIPLISFFVLYSYPSVFHSMLPTWYVSIYGSLQW